MLLVQFILIVGFFAGDSVSISDHDGNFAESRLQECTHLVMFAAGTGFTPMVKLIYKSLVEDMQSKR